MYSLKLSCAYNEGLPSCLSRIVLEPMVVERHESVLLNKDTARKVMRIVDEALDRRGKNG